MRKKLLLINPMGKAGGVVQRSGKVNFAPLGLGYIAAVTPPHWEVKFVDEGIEPFRLEEADLVGLTAVTQNASRAYELAALFRELGIPTIMGGIHASTLPDEASRYVDTVVMGEAESIWKTVISDFERRKLKRIYVAPRPSLENLVLPRRDLYSDKYPIKGVIQSARGCPLNCDFCSVTAFNGGTYRPRPFREVLSEIEQMGRKLTFFVDDNILGYGKKAEQRAIKLFQGIVDRQLRIKWSSHAGINFAQNKEALKLAQKSGCFNLFIGFESLDPETLRSMHKSPNLSAGVQNYKDIIRTFHDYGIGITGGFIFGYDSETEDVFDRVTEFILSSEIDAAQLTVLNPLPGTKIYEQFKKQKRLLYTDYPKDWELYDNFANVLYKPKAMTPEKLREGVLRAYRATTSKRRTITRALTTLHRTKNFWATGTAYIWNDILGTEVRTRHTIS